MPDSVKTERHGDTAIVTLNRPEAMNAVDYGMREAIIAACAGLNADATVRAVVLTGAGDRAFSAGQDLAEAASFTADDVETWMRHQAALLQAIRDMDKPVLAAWNGVAVGVGFQIGLVADIRVGHAGIRVGQPEVRVGLPSVLGSHLMTLHLGHSHNVELSLLGRLITGNRAYELGILNELVPEGEVLARALEVAAEFAHLPPTAIRLTRQRFRELTQPGFDEACRATLSYHRRGYASGEPRTLMQRFLAERKR